MPPARPQWNPEHFYGHITERQAILIGVAATAFAMLFSVSVVAWVAYSVLSFFGVL